MMNQLENLGPLIRSLRGAKNMTQCVFADKLGVTPQAVSKWENGLGYPDIMLFPAIADTLEVSIEELFGRKPRVVTVIQYAS